METNEEKKDVEVKSGEPVQKEQTVQKKSGVKVIWIILGIVLAVFVILALYQGIAWLVSPERRHQKEVTTYMQEKYSEKFKVDFVKKRTAADYARGGCDGSECSYMKGYDHSTMEYIYKVYPVSNPKLVSYVVYAENTETGTHQIYETMSTEYTVCGTPSKEENVYEDNFICHQEKEELKGELEYLLGSAYTVDYDEHPKYITVHTERNLGAYALGNWEGFEELYNTLVKLLEGKKIQIQIRYKDKTLFINKNSVFEKDQIVLSVKPIEPVEEIQWN